MTDEIKEALEICDECNGVIGKTNPDIIQYICCCTKKQPDYKAIAEEMACEIQKNIDNQLKCGLKTISAALTKYQAMKGE